MGTTRIQGPRGRYDGERVVADLGRRGWSARDLARATGKSEPTIGRFLAGTVQTAKTAAAIALALGYPVRRYFASVRPARMHASTVSVLEEPSTPTR